MTLRRLFKLIIALTVTAGLLSTPFAATSLAKPQASVAGDMHAMDGDMHAMSSDTQAMPADRPCCPDEGKASDCAGCPLMALCMLSTSIPPPAETAALVTPDPLREAFSARSDAWVQGLAGHPPDHPPRNIV
jgi:hypothetical protein